MVFHACCDGNQWYLNWKSDFFYWLTSNAGESCMLVLWKSALSWWDKKGISGCEWTKCCWSVCGWFWACSWAEPVWRYQLVKLDLYYWISRLGKLLTAPFCIKEVTSVSDLTARLLLLVCDLTEQSYLLELEKIGSDAGSALDLKNRMLAQPYGKLWPVVWRYCLSGKWLSSLYLILELHSLTPFLKRQIWWGPRQHILPQSWGGGHVGPRSST